MLSENITSQVHPSWIDMAAGARQRCRLVQPAGGRAAETPGRSDRDTPQGPAGHRLPRPHCCCTAGEAGSGGGEVCVSE